MGFWALVFSKRKGPANCEALNRIVATHILVGAPFVLQLLPIRGGKQARANGEGFFVSIINWLLGGALGLMVTLATAAGRHTGPDRLRKPLSLSNSSPRGHADRRDGTGAILWKDMRE
ncbi:hypothetical protein [Rhizobium sp. IY2]|uniref:hypothetical protein n=1 Tax=Rhizobium sp. IY2 TaxID=3397853 RepID=UPI0039DFE8A3